MTKVEYALHIPRFHGARQKQKNEMGKIAKAVNDVKLRNRIESGVKTQIQVPYYIQNAVKEVQEIKKAKDELLAKANELATKVYEEAAKANQNAETTNEGSEEKDTKNDDVVDAEYEEK